MVLEHIAQLGGEALAIEEIVEAHGAARHLVFVGRPDSLAGGADLVAGGTTGLARLVERNVIAEDHRAARADSQAVTNLDATRLERFYFGKQVMDIEHHAVSDVALHALAHDPRRHQVELVLVLADDQGMTGIVSALEAHHAFGMIGQPVHDLALALVTPLGTDNHDVLCHF